MGDAIVADVRLTLEALLAACPESEPRAPEPRPGPEPPPQSDPAEPRRRDRRPRRGACPTTASLVVETPSSTLAVRNRMRVSRPGSYFFGAGGGLGFGLAAAVGVQIAEPERPVVCVVGEGSAQYAITALWSAVAHRASRSPCSSCATTSTRSSSGSRRWKGWRALPASTCRRSRAPRSPRPTGCRRAGSSDGRGRRRALRGDRLTEAGAGRGPGRRGNGHGLKAAKRSGAAGACQAAARPPQVVQDSYSLITRPERRAAVMPLSFEGLEQLAPGALGENPGDLVGGKRAA